MVGYHDQQGLRYWPKHTALLPVLYIMRIYHIYYPIIFQQACFVRLFEILLRPSGSEEEDIDMVADTPVPTASDEWSILALKHIKTCVRNTTRHFQH